jgi:hypothetical protein
VPVACLAQAGDALWACTPGTLDQPAIQHMSDGQPFARVVTLPEVTRLATCAPELEVERVCAAAWIEWQRDVLRAPVQGVDAGAPVPMEDAEQADAAPPEPDVSVAPIDEHDSEPAADPMDPVSASASSCTLHHGGERNPAALLALCLLGTWATRRRRARS